MKKFLFWLLQFTWCLPQNIIGGIMYLIYVWRNPHGHYKYALTCKMRFGGGISLGGFILLDNINNVKTTQHEYGHVIQSLLLGPLYLFVIGLPSIIWAGCFDKWRAKHNKSYYWFYTERWADRLGGVER